MSMIGIVARQVGLRRFQTMYQANPYEEVQVPINSEGRDLSLLAILEKRDQLVGRDGAIAGLHFCVGREARGC